MDLNTAKARGQARAVEIKDVVSIRRVKPRVFEIADGQTPFDKQLVILVHPTWVTTGHYKKFGWPEPEPVKSATS